MSLPLPNLDDRRWSDLVEEGRSLIPLYAPLWTDHNLHDPGVTAMELFAWIAEMDFYQLNRIPERHRRKFLALLGIQPEPPHPARTILEFRLANEVRSLVLPATVEFEALDPYGQLTRFRTLEAVTLIPNQLEAVQVKTPDGFRDMSRRWQRGEPFSLFGDDPQPGAVLYLGFKQSLPLHLPLNLRFTFWDLQLGEAQRQVLSEQAKRQLAACHAPDSLVSCQDIQSPTFEAEVKPPPHHSVRTVWEFLTVGERWQMLHSAAGEVEDDTRSFTLNGRVHVTLPQEMGAKRFGTVESALYYLRCRLVAGAYEAAPVLQNLAVNAAIAQQAIPIATRIAIAPGVVAEGAATMLGEQFSFQMQLNAQGEISQLRFLQDATELPSFKLLEFQPASTTRGFLSLEAAFLGVGTGKPWQQLRLQEVAIASYFQLFTLEQTAWRSWQLRPDLDASGRNDLHFLLDAEEGIVSFGNGEKGRVPPADVPIFALCQTTRAQDGNLDKGAVNQLADSLHNRAVLLDAGFDTVKKQLAVTNPLPAVGGSAAETVLQAAGRAFELRDQQQRAITLSDYETLAMQTPGVQLARVAALANLHPEFPCFKAPGIITLVILPYLPWGRPMPSRELRQAVAAYIAPRRAIGTQAIVVAPVYLEVAVRAKVQAVRGTNLNALQQKIVTALNQFFHPLTGGDDGKGWIFGRDVYRSEVLQVIDETPGVDRVLSLELISEGGEPQCGNICLGSLGLVAAGQHEIVVV